MLTRMRPAPRSQPGRGASRQTGTGAGSPFATRRSPHAALLPAAGAVRVGGDCKSSGPPGWCLGPGVLCAAEGPAQRKRDYPPPFPSALSPQARPLAAA